MKRTRHNPPKKKAESGFLKFSAVQCGYLNEIRRRQLNELNQAIESVYEEMGILERMKAAPDGIYILRQRDLSGVDFNPPSSHPPIDEEEEKRIAEEDEKKKAEALAKGKKPP